MPGFVTHCVFGARVLRALPEGQVRAAARKYPRAFYLGCQGPDLFSYNFFRMALWSHHNLGAYLHNNRVKRFFEQGFAQLPEGPEKTLCLAYLAGAYCHYVCDSVCHTFVYARTDYDPQSPSAALSDAAARIPLPRGILRFSFISLISFYKRVE